MLDTGAADPAFNMALDDVLLHGDGPPTLRLYGWSPPGLSLGWFQSPEPFRSVPGRHRIVRRRTGGGAIYHDDEITFSLALDAAALPTDIAAGYALLHRAVQRALGRVGVEVELVAGEGGCAARARPTQPWCFAIPGPNDLVVAKTGRKIAGSAQRRLRQPRARILHHGSIVLRAPAATPFCGAVADVVDPVAATPALRRALIEEISGALGLQPTLAAAAPDEILAAGQAAASFETPVPRGRSANRC